MATGKNLGVTSQLHYPSRYCDYHLPCWASWFVVTVELLVCSASMVVAEGEDTGENHAAGAAVVVAELSDPR